MPRSDRQADEALDPIGHLIKAVIGDDRRQALRILHDRPVNIESLAEALSRSEAWVTAVIDDFIENGLVETVVSSSGRFTVTENVSIRTEAGIETMSLTARDGSSLEFRHPIGDE